MGVPQNQKAPCIAKESQAARDWTRVITNIFIVHTILVVTRFQIGSNITFEMIVTLRR